MSYQKHWVFTVFADEVLFWDHVDVSYIVFGNEKCPTTGKWHKQGYVYFSVKKRMTALKKLDATAHWECKRGSVMQAVEYCKKDGDWYERGKCPVEERSNADAYAECIKLAEEGRMEDLKLEHPGQFLRYKRTFEGLLKYPIADLSEPRGYWIWGTPGSGKDSNVMQLKPYVKSHNKWWDGYAGEKYILWSDFTYDDRNYFMTYLLQWTDMYPFKAEYKGGVMTISPERFYVTSNYSLGDMFGKYDNYEAFVRRFHVINFDSGVVTKRPKIDFVDKVKLIDF